MNRALPPEDTPILIVISYWAGDLEACRAMVNLMVDLQPHHVGKACKVMLVCRQDCEIDLDMVKKLMTRFDTITHVSSSPLKGWPSGCNGMFSSAVRYVGNWIKTVDCIFWMEADCVPTCTNWFADLANVWKQRRHGSNVVGHMMDCDGNGRGMHITGCALYHPQISRILPEITLSDRMAWDYQHRAKIVAMGDHTPYILSIYKARDAQPSILSDNQAVVIHGYKDFSLVNLVRKLKVV